MKVSDILRVKGGTLFTATPDEPLAQAVQMMSERDIGSLVVMEQFSLLTRNRLDACTEPTSDWEIGVTVKVHGI